MAELKQEEIDGEIVFDNDGIIEDENLSGQKIYTTSGDREVKSLYEDYKDGDLILQPDFQRNFVWDRIRFARHSNFILKRFLIVKTLFCVFFYIRKSQAFY